MTKSLEDFTVQQSDLVRKETITKLLF